MSMLGGVSSTPDKSVSFTNGTFSNGTLSSCGVTGEVPLPDEHPIAIAINIDSRSKLVRSRIKTDLLVI
jgi:hypothetical protein